jgi:Holliday junction resolvase RusA-like endonuclease
VEGATLTFAVPWSALCSDNRKYVTGYVLSKEYRESKEFIGQLSVAAAHREGWQKTERDVGLRVVVTEPDRRRRDFNWSKNLKDGITQGSGIWDDDAQVRDEHWQFAPHDKANAGATLTIWILPETPTHEPPRKRHA